MKTWLMKFVEHFLWIAVGHEPAAGQDGMWDEEDGFYYDLLRFRTAVQRLEGALHGGAAPPCATTVIEEVAARAGAAGD